MVPTERPRSDHEELRQLRYGPVASLTERPMNRVRVRKLAVENLTKRLRSQDEKLNAALYPRDIVTRIRGLMLPFKLEKLKQTCLASL